MLDFDTNTTANISHNLFLWPGGRCIVLKPPHETTHIHIDINITSLLSQTSHNTIGRTGVHFSFTNSINAQTLSPSKTQIKEIFYLNHTGGNNMWTMYKVKGFQSQHQPNDPHIKCTQYTTHFTYTDCVRKELVSDYHKMFNCTPPLLATNKNETCNGQMKRSENLSDDQIRKTFWKNNFDFESSMCKIPCTQMVYEAEMKHKTRNDRSFTSVSLSIRVS